MGLTREFWCDVMSAAALAADDDGGAAAGGGLAAAAEARVAAAAGDGKAGADGKGSAGDAGGGAGGAEPGKTLDKGGGTDKVAADQVYHPEGLPDAFRGKDHRETIDKLWSDIKGRAAPPATAADYTIGEEAAKAVGDPAKDPVLGMYRDIAHELGLTQAQFDGSIGKLYAKMSEAGLIEKPVDLNAEFASLSDGTGDTKAQIAAGERVVMEQTDAIRALQSRGAIDKATADQLVGPLRATASGVKAIGALLKIAAARGGIEPGGKGGQENAVSAEDRQLRAMYPSMYEKAS